MTLTFVQAAEFAAFQFGNESFQSKRVALLFTFFLLPPWSVKTKYVKFFKDLRKQMSDSALST